MPGARCARSLACKIKKHTSIVTTVTPDSPGIPYAMVLTVSFVISPVIGLLSPSSRVLDAKLDAGIEASDHTTSPSASVLFVSSTIGVHRIPPRACDDRETPPCGAGQEGYRY